MSSKLKIPQDLCLDGPLWQFAGRFWSRARAQKAALSLQDRGWSVTDILCSLWLTLQCRRFSGFSPEQAEPAKTQAENILAWRSEVTEALRNARKAIIKGNPATDEVRNCIARSELEAERVELALAYRSLTQAVEQATPPVALAVTADISSVKTLALKNLQSAAPEKAMDNETAELLETLTEELQLFTEGMHQPC